jgi:hypothetical protein
MMIDRYGSVVKVSVTSCYENGRCRLFSDPITNGCLVKRSVTSFGERKRASSLAAHDIADLACSGTLYLWTW